VTNPQKRVALVRRFLQPIGWLWGHPMGTEHREWSGENNEREYTYNLSSKQKKEVAGACDIAPVKWRKHNQTTVGEGGLNFSILTLSKRHKVFND